MSTPYSGPPPTQPPDPGRPGQAQGPTGAPPPSASPYPQYPQPQYPPYPQNQPYPQNPRYGSGHQGPPPPEHGLKDGWLAAPRELRPVVVLLLINLALSVLLTVVTLVARHSLINYQLDHRHITDPQQRELLRDSYSTGIVSRVFGNIVVSVVYVFLVRALLRGRRWAYRRVIYVGAIGIVALVLLQITPYPAWMRVEQLLQAVVLGAMLYFVLRPGVKAHFDPSLPGRTTRRFQR